jgi:hypothetical protein
MSILQQIAQTGLQASQFDIDALNFINTAGITDITQRFAINNLTTDLKLNGIWTKFKAIYPMVGGSASSHSYNLKNTAQYQLTFNGGWTHGTTGAYPNGTDAFAQTGLNPSTDLSTNSTHLSYYSLTNSKAGALVGKVDIGCQVGTTTSFFMGISSFALFIAYMYTNASGSRIQIAEGTTAAGFFLTTRQSASSLTAFSTQHTSSSAGFVRIANVTSTGGSLPNNEVYLAVNGNTGSKYEYSNRGCGFASIGDGLSDNEVQLFGAIVQRYVNTLGRQVFSVPTVQDIDAQEFITAAGITAGTQAQAIQNLTTDLKQKSLWGKMKAIYPFAGSTQDQQFLNLKTPQNDDGAFRMNFIGGWTHNINGATPNGTSGYGNPNFIPNTHSNINDTHFSIYSRNNEIGGFKTEMGVVQSDSQRTLLITKWTTNQLFADMWDTDERVTVNMASINTTGLFTVSRTSSTSLTVYRNGSSIGTNTTTSTGSLPTLSLFLSALNNAGTAANFSTKQIAFASIGDGLSASESSDFYNIVQNYQTALSRNV